MFTINDKIQNHSNLQKAQATSLKLCSKINHHYVTLEHFYYIFIKKNSIYTFVHKI